jgi:hypothetical protein
MGHPPRVPVWLDWEQRVIYFVTICVANREPVLANDRAFGAFKAAVAKLQNWDVLAAVLMPDHLHVIVSASNDRDAKLGNFSGALKRWIRRELNARGIGSPVVLIGCYARMNRFMRSGSMLKIIQCGLGLFNARWIGRIELAWMINFRATARKAEELASGALALQRFVSDRRRLRQSDTAATDERRNAEDVFHHHRD